MCAYVQFSQHYYLFLKYDVTANNLALTSWLNIMLELLDLIWLFILVIDLICDIWLCLRYMPIGLSMLCCSYWVPISIPYELCPCLVSFLANVNSRSRSLYAIARPSVCLSSVCRLSVTFVHPTQAVQIFGNISTVFGTLAFRWHPLKISRRSSQGNPSAGGVKHKRGSKI